MWALLVRKKGHFIASLMDDAAYDEVNYVPGISGIYRWKKPLPKVSTSRGFIAIINPYFYP